MSKEWRYLEIEREKKKWGSSKQQQPNKQETTQAKPSRFKQWNSDFSNQNPISNQIQTISLLQ